MNTSRQQPSHRNERETQASSVPVLHSILLPEALLATVAEEYAIGSPVECTVLRANRNDTYLLKTTNDQYILRVYGTSWRTEAQIRFELDLLTYLNKKGIHVSTPIPRKDGLLMRKLAAPEGPRYLVMFTHAPGVPLYGERIEMHSHLFGHQLAALHNATDDFTRPFSSLHHDLSYLIDRPLELIRPFFAHRPTDWVYLQHLAAWLRDGLSQLASQLRWGICHGDPTSVNAFLTENLTITWFDFDSAGLGWHANDLSTVRDLARHRKNPHLWNEFLQGYTELRSVNEAEIEAIPFFVAAGDLWVMGSNVVKGTILGHWRQDDAYFDGMLKGLREWETTSLPPH
jgi:Ser/Thr protein kinase RdoA (MazF antagonist)